MDAADITESFYGHLFMTELTWPPAFFGLWAAGEPDVSSFPSSTLTITCIAHRALPLGEGTSEPNVPR